MAIVASNSITVSNVNDGTITHTAYAYSADGTDRFTTAYPNLNLLLNSSAKTKDGFFKNFDKVENDYGEVTLKGTNTYVGRGLWEGFSIQPRDYTPGDKYTISMDVMFTSWNVPAGTTLTEFWMGQRYTQNSAGTIGVWKQICYIDLPRDPSQMLNQWIRITQTSTIPPYADPSVSTDTRFQTKFTGPSEGSFTFRVRKPKQEFGSTATPWMPSASEVKTSDYPSYIGQYSDFTSTVSTDPAKYAPWTIFKGKDGIGIQTTDITYAISTSGTTAPSTGWTSSVPSLVKGQYLWTKTGWTYTDNSSETGYSVTYISKDGTDGDDGLPGKDGTGIKTTTITYAGSTSGTIAPTSGWTSTVPTVAAGSYLWTKTVWAYTDNSSETGYSVAMMGAKGDNGDPTGITKSATEPENKFDGMIWYVDSNVDVPSANMQVGSVAQSHGQYTWNGTKWSLYMLRSINMMVDNGFIKNAMISDATIDNAKISSVDASKIVADSISAISANLGNITAGTYTSWSIEDYDVYDYLSGIYLFKGGIRFFTIENPNTTDPDMSGVASGKMIRGMSIISGVVQFYQQQIPLEDTRTANAILKEVDGFWTPYSDVGGYCGSISSYKYSGGIGQLTLNADLISVQGKLETNAGVISNSSSVTVALFYGMSVVFRRQGNLVTASITRQIVTTSATGEDIMTNEKVPSGYRPSYSHYFGINRNSGTNILKDLVMGIASNGDVRVTIGETGAAMFTGSTSYFTTDPLP